MLKAQNWAFFMFKITQVSSILFNMFNVARISKETMFVSLVPLSWIRV